MSEGSCNLRSSPHSDADSFVKRGGLKDEEFVEYQDDLPPLRRREQNTGMDSSVEAEVEESTIKATGSPCSYHILAVKFPQQIVQAAFDTLWTAAKFVCEYSVILVIKTLRYLHQPFALFLSFYVLTFMAGHISQRIFQDLSESPICIIPGISSLSLCRLWKPPAPSESPKSPDYSTLMNMQSKSFDHLLQELAGGSGLSLQIKKAEMATSDLVTRVRLSKLNARDSIARALSKFVSQAKKTGRGLQRLTAKVGGSVDNIMAVNNYALRSIEAARIKEQPCWFPQCLILVNEAARKRTDQVIAQTFDQAMSVLSINMERLILEAEQCLHNLNDLEEQLVTLHQMTAREDTSISAAKSDLLENLWTRLGGNRKSLRNFDHHLTTLKEMAFYRQQAFVHVVAAMQTLQAMSDDMEDMRDRVAAPDLAGAKIPVEVHIQSIQVGLDRLRQGRMVAKRLEEDAVRSALAD